MTEGEPDAGQQLADPKRRGMIGDHTREMVEETEARGHMSAFTIGSARYESAAASGGWSLDLLGGARPRSMNARLREVTSPDLAFHYEYDFGSTTNLRPKVASVREGRIGRRPLCLLARNEPAA